MKFSHLFLATAAAGMLAGAAGQRLSRGSGADSPGSGPAADRRGAGEERRQQLSRTAPALPAVRSADSPDALLALPPDQIHARLALWLVDASQEEIAAFWQSYRAIEDPADPIEALILINWAQHDPEAALAAVAGTPDEHSGWSAWACEDPAAALAAVLARNPDQLRSVAWALGAFHPDWVRQHWDELPDEAKGHALETLARADGLEDPLAVLTFVTENGNPSSTKMLKALVEKDPWAAYDWIRDHGRLNDRSRETFIDTLAAEDPEMLEKIASQAPSGEWKREMEAALFAALMKDDPEAARQQALATDAPNVAIDRLTALGQHLLASDPDQAFALAERIFALDPQAMINTERVENGDGEQLSQSSRPEVRTLLQDLVRHDPRQAVGLVMPAGDSPFLDNTFSFVSSAWAKQDLDGFADWVREQDDPVLHRGGVNKVVANLKGHLQFAEAGTWVLDIADESYRQDSLTRLVRDWSRSDPESAAVWVENAGLSPEEAAKVQRYLPEKP